MSTCHLSRRIPSSCPQSWAIGCHRRSDNLISGTMHRQNGYLMVALTRTAVLLYRFPPPDVHIKGLDDSRVAAEVERRRIEADKERRERERRETRSRTVEREAAAHFRIGVWRVSWSVGGLGVLLKRLRLQRPRTCLARLGWTRM